MPCRVHEPATLPARRHGRRTRRRHAGALRPGRHRRRPSPGAEAPGLSGHRRVVHAGADAAAQGQRRGQRVHHRGPDRGRPQRAAARQAATDRAGRADLRRARQASTSPRFANSACRSGWRVATARPRACVRPGPRAPRESRWGQRSRCAPTRGMRPDYRAALLEHVREEGAAREDRSPGVTDRLPVQGGQPAGHRRARGRLRRRARASATSATCAKPIARTTARLAIDARPSPCRCTSTRAAT